MSEAVPPKPGAHKAALRGVSRLPLGSGRSILNLIPERLYSLQMAVTLLARRTNLFIVNAPPTVREVMVEKTALYPKHAFLVDILQPLVGQSLFNTNGPAWEQQRRLVDQAFAQAGLRRAFPLMLAAVTELIDRIDMKGVSPPGEPRVWDADAAMSHVTADIIFRTVLSVPLAAAEAAMVHHAFRAYQVNAQRVMGLSALRLPTAFHRWRCQHWGAVLRRPYAVLIRQRFAALAQADEPTQTPVPDDMLSTLIRARDPATGAQFSESEVVGQVGTLFLAGHETSATTLRGRCTCWPAAPRCRTRCAARSTRCGVTAPRNLATPAS